MATTVRQPDEPTKHGERPRQSMPAEDAAAAPAADLLSRRSWLAAGALLALAPLVPDRPFRTLW